MIVYLLLILNVLSMDLPVVNQCPICYENFNRQRTCMSFFSLRAPITLHISHQVKHEFCEYCVSILIPVGNNLISCPICRYELQIQDEDQLPKKQLKCKSNSCYVLFKIKFIFSTLYSSTAVDPKMLLFVHFK